MIALANDSEKRYGVGELELLGAVWALDVFGYEIYLHPEKF